jgi:protein-S-isoprenylcysteine O-methyltransferase Ste14
MRYVLGRGFSAVLFALLLFVSAGRLNWPRAWVFLGLVLLGELLTAAVLAAVNPVLLERRGRMEAGTKAYDRAFVALAAPLILGSLWAFAPALASALLFTVRTALEDRTLREELAGYQEYASRTRHRLLPGIW